MTGRRPISSPQSPRHLVLAACGHWWTEDADPDAKDGEERACADHVEPMRYPVIYLPAPLPGVLIRWERFR